MTPAPTWPSSLDGRYAALGIAVVEFALTPSDLAHMDAAVPALCVAAGGAHDARVATSDIAWLSRHRAVGALARTLVGEGVRLREAWSTHGAPAGAWRNPWQQGGAGQRSGQPGSGLPREATGGPVELCVFLDPCDEDCGPLEVLPGSHREGILDRASLKRYADTVPPLVCLTVRGDIVALHPHIIWRRQQARVPRTTRCLHLIFEPESMGSQRRS